MAAKQRRGPETDRAFFFSSRSRCAYSVLMQRKMFWIIFAVLGLIADLTLPFWWAVAATFPILAASWWIAYRSDWF